VSGAGHVNVQKALTHAAVCSEVAEHYLQGVNIMAFCKEYNAATQDKVGTVIPVEITIFEVTKCPVLPCHGMLGRLVYGFVLSCGSRSMCSVDNRHYNSFHKSKADINHMASTVQQTCRHSLTRATYLLF
jgi:hypothetical protein